MERKHKRRKYVKVSRDRDGRERTTVAAVCLPETAVICWGSIAARSVKIISQTFSVLSVRPRGAGDGTL
jgi:hypothetical protein